MFRLDMGGERRGALGGVFEHIYPCLWVLGVGGLRGWCLTELKSNGIWRVYFGFIRDLNHEA